MVAELSWVGGAHGPSHTRSAVEVTVHTSELVISAASLESRTPPPVGGLDPRLLDLESAQ